MSSLMPIIGWKISVSGYHLNECDRRSVSQCLEAEKNVLQREVFWANRRIARHMGRSHAAEWQEWVNSGKFQRHDRSG
ncbi:hypothetical protein TNCV_1075251 [Trichonephila clavipes]|uniref:Uncharacterized protein n=1 Tax=Trichonephila clavipes TaxID=2585209 RepID=A0A8X6SUT4_TRICX|nr:hypothetical protein TNCV_1075251 [Trichonephila clavipes]